MKAHSTIYQQYRRLVHIYEDEGISSRRREEAYAMATALQWVLYRTDWSLVHINELES